MGEDLGPAASKAGRRYAAGLTGLFGPSLASPARSGLRPPLRSAGPFGLRPWRLCRYLQPILLGLDSSCRRSLKAPALFVEDLSGPQRDWGKKTASLKKEAV